MTAQELITDVVGVLTIVAIVGGFAATVWRRLRKSKQREIDERVEAVIARRAEEQKGGTPVEIELRRQLAELKAQASRDREQSRRDMSQLRGEHRQEIDDLRTEHDREINDLRRTLTSEVDSFRAQLTEAYRTRPNAAGGTA